MARALRARRATRHILAPSPLTYLFETDNDSSESPNISSIYLRRLATGANGRAENTEYALPNTRAFLADVTPSMADRGLTSFSTNTVKSYLSSSGPPCTL